MVDYREVIVSYTKAKLSDIDVLDGSQTFEQPSDNYATYYILSETMQSFNNDSITDSDNDEVTYTPLVVAELRISVRGNNSFSNVKMLWNSFDIIDNKVSLSEDGVYFMAKGGITQLPTLKNTRLQEGYLFSLTFNYDNSFTNTETLAEETEIDGN